MREIALTQGRYAIVDEEVYRFLMQWNWYAVCTNGMYYAQRKSQRDCMVETIYMHREIMTFYGGAKCQRVSHLDGNGLNNRRSNLSWEVKPVAFSRRKERKERIYHATDNRLSKTST